jgi:hypothetical protein
MRSQAAGSARSIELLIISRGIALSFRLLGCHSLSGGASLVGWRGILLFLRSLEKYPAPREHGGTHYRKHSEINESAHFSFSSIHLNFTAYPNIINDKPMNTSAFPTCHKVASVLLNT